MQILDDGDLRLVQLPCFAPNKEQVISGRPAGLKSGSAVRRTEEKRCLSQNLRDDCTFLRELLFFTPLSKERTQHLK